MISILGEKSTAKAFRKALASAKDGDEILLARTKVPGKTFMAHPDGVLLQKGETILLNGVQVLYEGACDEWGATADGVIVREGYRLVLNGKEPLYEGHFDRWSVHPAGIVVERDNQLLLNGTRLLHRGADDAFFEWETSLCFPTFLVKQGGEYLLNGKDRLAIPSSDSIKGAARVHPDGIVFESRAPAKGFLLPGGEVMEADDVGGWLVHKHGILFSSSRGDFTEYRFLVRKTFDADEVIV